MKNKLVKASLAGVAAIAIAAGGSTYASWTDFDTVNGNKVGADELALNVGQYDDRALDDVKLAPGSGSDWEYVVASRTGQTVQKAELYLSMTDLVGKEDGCTSTRSEKEVDPNCGDKADGGDFVDDAVVTVHVSEPTTDLANACRAKTTVSPVNPPSYTQFTRVTNVSLANFASGQPLNLLGLDKDNKVATLAPGQGVCVKVGVQLPKAVDNASQGDSAKFNLRWDLKQQVA
jgi:predicted ribosomally synthesized peptide with SipW-like signal peptide